MQKQFFSGVPNFSWGGNNFTQGNFFTSPSYSFCHSASEIRVFVFTFTKNFSLISLCISFSKNNTPYSPRDDIDCFVSCCLLEYRLLAADATVIIREYPGYASRIDRGFPLPYLQLLDLRLIGRVPKMLAVIYLVTLVSVCCRLPSLRLSPSGALEGD